MADRPPVSPEDIPQSVVERAADALWTLSNHGQGAEVTMGEQARTALLAALAEYERLGYRLVRDDEATVERMAKAISESRDYEEAALAALTAAQGGEGRVPCLICGGTDRARPNGTFASIEHNDDGWPKCAACQHGTVPAGGDDA